MPPCWWHPAWHGHTTSAVLQSGRGGEGGETGGSEGEGGEGEGGGGEGGEGGGGADGGGAAQYSQVPRQISL